MYIEPNNDLYIYQGMTLHITSLNSFCETCFCRINVVFFPNQYAMYRYNFAVSFTELLFSPQKIANNIFSFKMSK